MDGVRLTGLWKEKGKDGRTYLTGSLSPTARLMIFPNSHKKEGGKDPDYFLYVKVNEKKDKPAPDAQGDDL